MRLASGVVSGSLYMPLGLRETRVCFQVLLKARQLSDESLQTEFCGNTPAHKNMKRCRTVFHVSMTLLCTQTERDKNNTCHDWKKKTFI